MSTQLHYSYQTINSDYFYPKIDKIMALIESLKSKLIKVDLVSNV